MDPQRYAEKLISDAIDRGDLDPSSGVGEPLRNLDDDPDWWVRSFLEREQLPDQRQQLATEIDRLIDAAIAEPELTDARAKLGVANALARRWNGDHEPADAFAERSEVWLLSERARRPAD